MYSMTVTSFKVMQRCPLSSMMAVSSISRISYRDSTYNSRITSTMFDKYCFSDHDEDKKRKFSTSSIPRHKLDVGAILSQTRNIFAEVQVKEVAKAPLPIFWYGVGGLVPIVGPTLSFLLFGFSPCLATIQLTFSATICSFLGGIKWGFAVCEKSGHAPTWENLGWAVVPQLVAWLGLMFPQSLGFILVSGGLAASAFMDLTTVNYPQWFRALRLALTVPVLFCLVLSAFLRLIH